MISRLWREAGLACRAIYRSVYQLKLLLVERARDLKTEDMKPCLRGRNKLSEGAMGPEKEVFPGGNKAGICGFGGGANSSPENPKEEVTYATSTSCTRTS